MNAIAKIDFPKLNQFLDVDLVLNLISNNTKRSYSNGKIRTYCPIHGSDNQQSLVIYPDEKSFKCHSCGASGDLINLYALSKNISQYEAAEYLQSSFDVDLSTIPSSNLQEYNSRDKTKTETVLSLSLWEKAQELDEHPYLTKKQVKAYKGLKFGSDEKGNPAILVPFTSIDGKITAIEYINEHIKLFATGSKRSGSFFTINNEDYTQVEKAYIAEGIATALTIYEATKYELHRVVISCGPVDNILSVIEAIKSQSASLKIIACPDNDNSGKNASQKILQKNYSNVYICMPNFDGLQTSKKDTDFNDLQKLAGIENVKQQLQNNTSQVKSTMIKPAIEIESFEPPSTTQNNTETILPLDNKFSYLLSPNSEEKLINDIKSVSKGISTGYTIGEIDLIFPGGAISVIAAPTSHGKTTALINFCLNAIKENPETNAYFFSYEESESSILTSFLNTYISKIHHTAGIAESLSVNSKRSIESFYRNDTMEFINQKLRGTFTASKDSFFKELIDAKRLKIIYSEISIEELVAAIKFIKKNDPKVGIICIDYIQLLRLKTSKLSRQEQVKEICTQLKNCAIETGLPIVTAAQFNRTVQTEADMSVVNIGEAGDIERIASLVIGMFNRNFIMHKDGNKNENGEIIKPENTIYFKVLKGRNIGVGHNVIMNFNGNTGTLLNQPNDAQSTQVDTNKIIPIQSSFKKKHETKYKA